MTVLSILTTNRSQIVGYLHYLNLIVPSVALGIALAGFIFFIFVLYTTKTESYITITTGRKLESLLVSVAYSAVLSACVFTLTLCVLCSGCMLSPFASPNSHPVREETVAISMQRTEIPRLKRTLNHNHIKYTHTDRPTKLEKQMEPVYANAMNNRLHHDERFVNIMKHTKMHWYYYI